nr:VTT domain-containing protein [Thermosyntropha sp.]
MTFANAGLFGWIKGAILSWASAMVGQHCVLGLPTGMGGGWLKNLLPIRHWLRLTYFFERYGKWAVLVARLLPFMSFDIVSYAAGLTGMGFWEFLWATGLGQLPATLIYSYVGDMLAGSARNFVFGLLLLFALSALVFMGRRIWNDRQTVA